MTEKIYIGTKIIAAEPMTEMEFLSEKHNSPNIIMDHPDRPGYHVRYEDGYVSWSPKEVFERCYREVSLSEATLASGWLNTEAWAAWKKEKEPKP